MASDKKVRVGIAGLGRSGWGIHGDLLSQLPDLYQVVAVFDPMAERREEARQKFGARGHESFEGLVADKDVEVVVVASPNHMHSPHTVQALKAGKHVACEKPMAADLAGADAMIAAAKQSGRIFTVFQNRRFEPTFLKVKEIVDSGVLGNVVEIKMTQHGFARRWDWQTLQKFGGGQLRNNGPHMLDQALALLGDGMPSRIFFHRECVLVSGDAEDQVKLVLTMPNGRMLDMEMSSACAFPHERFLIMGTQGTLTSQPGGLKWKFFDPTALPARPVDEKPTSDRSYNREDIPWQEAEWKPEAENWKKFSLNFYETLYKTIREGAPIVIRPEDVRRQIAIIEECLRQCPLEQKYF